MIWLLFTFTILFITKQYPCIAHKYDDNGRKEATKYLNQAMVHTINPCDDFYGFVCGKWNKTTSLAYESQYMKTKEEVAETLLSGIKNIDVHDSKTPKFYKSLYNFYQKCTAKRYDNETIIKDIYESLDKFFFPEIIVHKNGSDIYPWELNDNYTFWKFVGQLQSEQNTKFLISSQLTTVSINCTKKPILKLSPALIRIQNTMLDVFFEKVLGQYHNMSLNESEKMDTKNDMLNLEKDLMTNYVGKNFKKTSRKMPLIRLKTLIPTINWDSYFEGLLPKDVRETWLKPDTLIIVEKFNNFEELNALLEKYDLTTIYNLAYSTVIQRYYNFFVRETYEAIDERNIFAFVSFQDEVCLDYVFRYFSPAATRLLFDQYKVPINEWKYETDVIAQTVFSAFRYLVYSLDWMAMEDKVKIVQKVNNVKFLGDLPDWISNDEIVDKKTPVYHFDLTLVANDILAQKNLYRQYITPLITGVTEDIAPNFIANAFYFNMNIKVLLGEQLPPYYRHTYPLAVKFGHYGWTVGHELLHGFDSGRIDERPPTVSKWLSNTTFITYNQKVQCYVQQYSQHCFKEHKQCVSGRLTIDDNIADVEGMKIAYMAYKFASQLVEEEAPLEGEMAGYTWDQIFFITTARQYCDAGITEDVFTDAHAPSIVRVERSLMNFPSFAKAFHCEVGSRYAPIKTCSLWGNFWE